ncbi:MAG TPA: Rieske 2Fe-2S domain-containing protein [Cyclobacteriaceae bacterium]|nr:Rieske 2Fe-2S domain-containing protein [Cyclobacteriaceae bacterium]
MNRREFVTQTCTACLGGGLLSTVLTACSSAHYATAFIESKGVSVRLSEFSETRKGQFSMRQFIIVHHDTLEFPIYLYRQSETEYSALWMKCTHQGSELHAAGDHLYCSSHGSEFDMKGSVTQGPAEKNLRSFPVSIVDDKIFIELT